MTPSINGEKSTTYLSTALKSLYMWVFIPLWYRTVSWCFGTNFISPHFPKPYCVQKSCNLPVDIFEVFSYSVAIEEDILPILLQILKSIASSCGLIVNTSVDISQPNIDMTDKGQTCNYFDVNRRSSLQAAFLTADNTFINRYILLNMSQYIFLTAQSLTWSLVPEFMHFSLDPHFVDAMSGKFPWL